MTVSCANDLNTLPDGDISGEQLNNDANSPEKILGGIYLDLRSNGAEVLPCTQISELWESKQVPI
ncbi:hypothetical protein OWR28_16840 [Chryseobacterium sp. 1B4]